MVASLRARSPGPRVRYPQMDEEATRGSSSGNDRDIDARFGWVTTQQAAKALGISPRTVRWHIDKGNIEAKPEGEGVKRTWLISIESLQEFRDARQAAGELPHTDRVFVEGAEIAADVPGNAIRELADRLVEEAARAAEYRVRLELTEQAQSTLEAELSAERVRREQAEKERDELRRMLEAASEPLEEPETAAEEPEGVGETPLGEERRPWWQRWFGS